MDIAKSGNLQVLTPFAPNLCVKFQINQTYSVRGMALPKKHFQALVTAPPSSWLG